MDPYYQASPCIVIKIGCRHLCKGYVREKRLSSPLLSLVGSEVPHETCCSKHQRLNVGIIIDQQTRVGKEQRIAMEIAMHDFDQCHCFNLLYTYGSSPSALIDLISWKQVDVIFGTVTLQEAALISGSKTGRGIPIISVPPAASAPLNVQSKLPNFIQMSTSITYQVQGIAALTGHFRWRKVVVIHEHDLGFSEESELFFTYLSDSLRAVGSSIEHHFSFPHVSSLSDLKAFVEKELKKLGSQNVRIFIVVQSSIEFGLVLFEKAKEFGMMEKGSVWIVSDEIADLLDSVNPSAILNMQGVIGLKTDYAENTENLREFKSKFRRKNISKNSIEEENLTLSIYSLRAYDSIRSLAEASRNLRGKINSTELVKWILSGEFEGLSGKISFKNGVLSQKPIFKVVNVIGKSYREVALWSPESGFSEDLVKPDGKTMNLGSGLTGSLQSIYWPGGQQTVPNGWSVGSDEKPLRIGVPAKGAFNQFVNVSYDPGRNTTLISGFSIAVFEAAVKLLPYVLHYEFVPYYGSYDEMVAEVHNKSLDAAVGDTEIMADRYVYAEFSQPYIESGLVMVVPVNQVLKQSEFLGLNAFTEKMWIKLAAMSFSTGAVVWLSEYASGNDQFTNKSCLEILSSIFWLSVTIISLSQRELIRSNVSKVVLAVWICVVCVVGASFTAILSSMMTVPRLQGLSDINQLRNTNAAVGCNGNSFIVRYLTDVLHFRNVRGINSINDYPRAFESGEIKAAFFVAPHAKVFLAEYCKGYAISGPTFKLGGFGFVFQKGSLLAVDISEAVLKVTQSGQINTLEKDMLHLANCSAAGSDDLRLGPGPFMRLFEVLGGVIGLASLIAAVRLAKMYWARIRSFVLIMKKVLLCATLYRKPSMEKNVPCDRLETNLAGIQVPRS
ncbi:glutamate receptor 2.6-like isoform X2 [Andrographis paniculata]|uniref:glutamate receptor 2.6-like isoform X2 n=1 Tax=Andrographis paniculata TaxID=175694 RepID=UPI0021E76D6F|nr:glutamate receptor 2.6-like isoform X2 [Andrographis paniculata]